MAEAQAGAVSDEVASGLDVNYFGVNLQRHSYPSLLSLTFSRRL